MQGVNIVRECTVKETARVIQMNSLFDVPPAERSRVEWTVELPIDGMEWNVGLIVGPSGAGKSTIAREIFKDAVVDENDWPEDKSILDGFPQEMGIKDITKLLSSVGFASPPSWVRPYRVLSTGEKFRADMARVLAERPELAVVDEFTSTVDRTVARIGSYAISKTVKKRKQRFVAVSCHYDIVDWMEPDWVYDVHKNSFTRRRLRRPSIELVVKKVHRDTWDLFKKHHYLTAKIHHSATCYVGFIEGIPVVFNGVKWSPHPTAPGWRSIRVVTLPDYQGIGLGNTMANYVASLYAATGFPYRAVTGHPSLIAARAKSPLWKMIRRPRVNRGKQRFQWWEAQRHRVTATFLYTGPPNEEDARGFGLIPVRYGKRSKALRLRGSSRGRRQALPGGGGKNRGDSKTPRPSSPAP